MLMSRWLARAENTAEDWESAFLKRKPPTLATELSSRTASLGQTTAVVEVVVVFEVVVDDDKIDEEDDD